MNLLGSILLAALAFADEDLVRKIEAQPCALDSRGGLIGTQAEGICLDCIYGTQSTPALPKKIDGVNYALKKASAQKTFDQMELEFFKMADARGLFKAGEGDGSEAGETIEVWNLQIEELERNKKDYLERTAELKSQIAEEKQKIQRHIALLSSGKVDSKLKDKLSDFLTERMSPAFVESQKLELQDQLDQARIEAQQSKNDELLAADVKLLEKRLADFVANSKKEVKEASEAHQWLLKSGGVPVPESVKKFVRQEGERAIEKEKALKLTEGVLKNVEKEIKDARSKLEVLNKKFESAFKNLKKSAADDKKLLGNYRVRAKQFLQTLPLKDFANTCGMLVSEIIAIRWYTGDAYKWVNKALRDPSSNPEQVRGFKFILNSALRKLATYKGEVYRGATLPAKVLSQHAPGAIVSYEAFTSSSLEPGFAGQQNFVILSKSGKFVGTYSTVEEEEEVLFPAGTKFKVLENKDNRITMEEVDP